MKDIVAGSAAIFTITSALIMLAMRDLELIPRAILVACSLCLWAIYGVICWSARPKNRYVKLGTIRESSVIVRRPR